MVRIALVKVFRLPRIASTMEVCCIHLRLYSTTNNLPSVITDGNGRGCILTPPSTQFQCDSGATLTPGFSIGCDGSVSYNASTTFWVCATGDHGGYNIYTVPIPNQPSCAMISLNADSCHNCPAPAPAPTPAPKICPANLAGNYEVGWLCRTLGHICINGFVVSPSHRPCRRIPAEQGVWYTVLG